MAALSLGASSGPHRFQEYQFLSAEDAAKRAEEDESPNGRGSPVESVVPDSASTTVSEAQRRATASELEAIRSAHASANPAVQQGSYYAKIAIQPKDESVGNELIRHGTVGRPLKIAINVFPLSMEQASLPVHKYHITPSLIRRGRDKEEAEGMPLVGKSSGTSGGDSGGHSTDSTGQAAQRAGRDNDAAGESGGGGGGRDRERKMRPGDALVRRNIVASWLERYLDMPVTELLYDGNDTVYSLQPLRVKERTESAEPGAARGVFDSRNPDAWAQQLGKRGGVKVCKFYADIYTEPLRESVAEVEVRWLGKVLFSLDSQVISDALAAQNGGRPPTVTTLNATVAANARILEILLQQARTCRSLTQRLSDPDAWYFDGRRFYERPPGPGLKLSGLSELFEGHIAVATLIENRTIALLFDKTQGAFWIRDYRGPGQVELMHMVPAMAIGLAMSVQTRRNDWWANPVGLDQRIHNHDIFRSFPGAAPGFKRAVNKVFRPGGIAAKIAFTYTSFKVKDATGKAKKFRSVKKFVEVSSRSADETLVSAKLLKRPSAPLPGQARAELTTEEVAQLWGLSAAELTGPSGVLISVTTYFRHKHGLNLGFPNLPPVNLGGPSLPMWIPMEFCSIHAPQKFTDVLPEAVAATIKAAALPAPLHRAKLMNRLHSAGFAQDPFLQAFRIRHAPSMLKVL